MTIRYSMNLLYRQQSYNLLREETEGFSKLVTELYTSAATAGPEFTFETAHATFERVKGKGAAPQPADICYLLQAHVVSVLALDNVSRAEVPIPAHEEVRRRVGRRVGRQVVGADQGGEPAPLGQRRPLAGAQQRVQRRRREGGQRCRVARRLGFGAEGALSRIDRILLGSSPRYPQHNSSLLF